ncbi:hypothetical protein OG357_22445 [Streptomyces sp. NBC_01255]|uniref:hypothetical protein n=1 Tax=Streptomyces sp. NBC_01255 TaxID=2903798 RepID=UPI002E360411|nr:hypothetical protein [Streptomyces sp. NBC_01255]
MTMNPKRIAGLVVAGTLVLGATGWAAAEAFTTRAEPVHALCLPDLTRDEYVPAAMSRLAYATVEETVGFAPDTDGGPGGIQKVRLRVLHTLKGEVPGTLTLGQGVGVSADGDYTSHDPQYPVLRPGRTYVVGYAPDPTYGDGYTRYAKQEPDSALDRWTTYVSRGAAAPLGEGCGDAA